MIRERCPRCDWSYPAGQGHVCTIAASKPSVERNRAPVTPVTPVTVTPVTEPPRNTVTVTPELDRIGALEARVAKLEAFVAGKDILPDGALHSSQSRAEYMREYRSRKRAEARGSEEI